MTRYYLDTEFIDDGKTIELLSIGVVSDLGHEFYAEVAGVDTGRANDWVKAHVLPNLRGGSALMDREDLVHRLVTFVGDGPELWSWCSAYDWVALCQLYGAMADKPKGWPSYCRDLQQELDRYGLSDEQVPPRIGRAHHALADAHWHRDIHLWLMETVADEDE